MLSENDSLGRHKPNAGVHVSLAEPTIVFITVCTEKRVPWLAQPAVHDLLKQSWTEADAWLVGYYLLMPDHLHFFAAPQRLDIPFARWMTYWKRLFTQKARRLFPKHLLLKQAKSCQPIRIQIPPTGSGNPFKSVTILSRKQG